MKSVSKICGFILAISCANTFALTCRDPIRESAFGETQTEAINKAIVKALKTAGGTLVLSNQHVKGYHNTYELVKDEILEYSANYVDSWRLISTGSRPIMVEVDVCVSSTKIANRVLSGNTDSKKYDGQRTAIQLQTIYDSLDNAKKLMNQIFEKYPRNAYDVELKKHNISLDKEARPVLGVHYKLTWNRNFLGAFQDAVKATSINDPNPANRYKWVTGISFIGAPTNGVIFTTKNENYVYGDRIIFDHVNSLIYNPFLVVELLKNDSVLYRFCKIIPRQNFYSESQWFTGFDFNYRGAYEEYHEINDGKKEFEIAIKSANELRVRVDHGNGCTTRIS